jgi:hypothetical protein
MTSHTVLYISSELAGVDELNKSFTRLDCYFIALRDLGEALATAFLNRTLDFIVLDQRNESVNSKLARLFKAVRPGATLVSLYREMPQIKPEHIDVCVCLANDSESVAGAVARILQREQLAA